MSTRLKAALAIVHPPSAKGGGPSDAALVARCCAGDVRVEEAIHLRRVGYITSLCVLAALALPRLQLGALADPRQASRDLQRAFALGLPLARQKAAYAQLAEAHERAGDGQAACAALAHDARRFPGGTRVEAELRRCQVERDP